MSSLPAHPTPMSKPSPTRLIALCSWQPVRRALERFCSHQQFQLAWAESLEQVLAELRQSKVDLLVLAMTYARTQDDALKALLGRPEHGQLAPVFMTRKPEHPNLVSRAAGIPRAQLVCGGPRFVPRVLEALAMRSGAAERIHLSDRERLPGRVEGQTPAESASVKLENLSTTGAKLTAPVDLPLGQPLTVAVDSPALSLSAKAEVVRKYPNGDQGWHVGLRFLNLAPQQVEQIRAFITDAGTDAFRASPRLSLPKKLKVKARLSPVGSGQRFFADVVNVSEGGFLAVARFKSDLAVHQHLEGLLLWEGTSLPMLCEIARRSPVSGKPGHYEYGIRFITLNRAARSRLSSLLAAAGRLGIRSRKAQAPEREQSGGAAKKRKPPAKGKKR